MPFIVICAIAAPYCCSFLSLKGTCRLVALGSGGGYSSAGCSTATAQQRYVLISEQWTRLPRRADLLPETRQLTTGVLPLIWKGHRDEDSTRKSDHCDADAARGQGNNGREVPQARRQRPPVL